MEDRTASLDKTATQMQSKLAVIILKGLPACGKTTIAKAMQTQLPDKYKRVNRDEMRTMLDNGKWTKENEKMIVNLRDTIIVESLKLGKSVIVDDTNLSPKNEKNIRELVNVNFNNSKGIEVVVFDGFTKDPKVCIDRDLQRLNSVGQQVIMEMYNQFMRPKILDGVKTVSKAEEKSDLPYCIICDIDGTLAIKGDRSPYNWKKVGIDSINNKVADLIQCYDLQSKGQIKIILVSGRDAVCQPETLEWLKRMDVKFSALLMRDEGDNRKDSIVKRELFDKHIRGKYNVLFVLDDRNQTVDMWRNELGLTCFQVAEGNF